MLTIGTENKNFFPTPEELVKQMCDKLHGTYRTILEPSAGKGDMAAVVSEYLGSWKHRENIGKKVGKYANDSYFCHSRTLEIDCCEIDPVLQQTLLGREDWPNDNEVRLVHDDFLTYQTYKSYDLIIANFPFSEGATHLLHAMEMQERTGGEIVCLINANTLRNTYSHKRQILKKKLDALLETQNASVDFIENAFADAERKTDVEVALIWISYPEPYHASHIWDECKKAAESEKKVYAEKAVVSNDFFEALVAQYNMEAKAGMRLLDEYEGMKPYILDSKDSDSKYARPIIEIKTSPNDFLRKLRTKYWEYLFASSEFTGKLTSNLQSMLSDSLYEMKNYDFSLFNIRQILFKLMQSMQEAVQDEILLIFDKLSAEHSWIDKSSANVHYYNGWKTNKAHKINKKVIIPAYGGIIRGKSESQLLGTLDCYAAGRLLSDIEKCLNYLDMGETMDVDLGRQLERYSREGKTKNISLKYFDVTFYKKGTCHILFTCDPKLLEKLNIYGSQKKGWLPPDYGKKSYSDMDSASKAVIDEFQGAEMYEAVMNRADYFLDLPETHVTAPMLRA